MTLLSIFMVALLPFSTHPLVHSSIRGDGVRLRRKELCSTDCSIFASQHDSTLVAFRAFRSLVVSPIPRGFLPHASVRFDPVLALPE